MNVPRRSTVYDLASLRLHTDGSRVYQSSSTNLKPRNAKLALRDIRGNWIARDAGGTAKIPRWKNVSTPATEDGSVELEELSQSNLVEPELEEQEKQGDKEDEEGDEQNTLKRKPKRIDRRTAKRRKFAHDQSYLGETAADANFTEESRFLPLPSSDLLKSIHYFAANYYSERGQLLNISREYRAKRKAKRLAKRAKRQAAEGRGSVDITASRCSSLRRSQTPRHGSDDEDNFDSEDEDGEEDEDKDDSEEDEEYEDTSKKGKKRPKRDQGSRFRDMYKVFDGSALMAIGMIVQEHVTRLLEPRVPDGWEDSVQTAFPNGVWADDQEESEEETWLRDVKTKGAGIINNDNGEVGEGDNEEEQDEEGDNEEEEEDNEEDGEQEEEGEDEEEGDNNDKENNEEEDEEEKTEDDENQTPSEDDSEGSHVMATRRMTRRMMARKATKP